MKKLTLVLLMVTLMLSLGLCAEAAYVDADTWYTATGGPGTWYFAMESGNPDVVYLDAATPIHDYGVGYVLNWIAGPNGYFDDTYIFDVFQADGDKWPSWETGAASGRAGDNIDDWLTNTNNLVFEKVAVPEPASMLMFALAGASIVVRRFRK